MAKRKRSKQFKDSSQVIDIEEARRKRLEKRSRQHKRRPGQSAAAAARAEAERPARASVRQAKKRRTMIYAAIILAIVAVIGISVYNIITLKQEQKEILKQQQELKDQKAELQEELDQLTNSQYIEEQARTQLRLVLPGEKIYVPSADDKETKDEN